MCAKRITAPIPDPNPSGLCFCGCGKPTHEFTSANTKRGNYIGHHARYLSGHNVKSNYREEDRGFKTSCWIWQGASGKNYGGMRNDGKLEPVHRVYYESKYGKVPQGLELDHLCRQTACCNPDHVEAVTHAVNCQRGACGKLTREQVEYIRDYPNYEKGSRMLIAEQFGIHKNTVSAIRNHKKRIQG